MTNYDSVNSAADYGTIGGVSDYESISNSASYGH